MPQAIVDPAELRRFAGSPRAFVALLAVILVPLIYGGLYTWANESPTTRVDQIPAAVVNLDEMVTLTGADGKEQPVLLGRLVAGKLTASTSSSNYSWTLTDAATAESGLADGERHRRDRSVVGHVRDHVEVGAPERVIERVEPPPQARDRLLDGGPPGRPSLLDEPLGTFGRVVRLDQVFRHAGVLLVG